MEHEGFGYPATDAEGTKTAQPERDLQAGDPNLVGAAPREEKKGITGRVKGLFHGHRKKDGGQRPRGMAGKIREKVAQKVGHGEDGEKKGPARLLSMSSSSSSMSSSDEEDIGAVGFALDPTGPAVAGRSLGREDFTSAPAGPGADFSDLSLKPHTNGTPERRHAEQAAEFAKSSNPVNPECEDASGEDVHHTPPTERSNSNFESGRDDASCGGVDHSLPTERSNSDYGSGRDDASYGGVDHSPTEAGNSNSNPSESEAVGAPGNSNQTASDEPRPSNPTG